MKTETKPVRFFSTYTNQKCTLRRSQRGTGAYGESIWIKPEKRQVAEFRPADGGSYFETEDPEEIRAMRRHVDACSYIYEMN